MKLGSFLNSINYSKEDIFLEDPEFAEKSYPAFVVNRCLSYFPDTILHANEMNNLNGLDNRLQYDYYRLSLRKRKRFSKWLKEEKIEDLELIKNFYNFSNQKAKDALRILTKKDLAEIKELMYTGGLK
jgi:hypothetical protein|tara:strand:+ start:363 stop:746 length:384 start_codon:yes stop_codon:yes gene_type:complete